MSLARRPPRLLLSALQPSPAPCTSIKWQPLQQHRSRPGEQLRRYSAFGPCRRTAAAWPTTARTWTEVTMGRPPARAGIGTPSWSQCRYASAIRGGSKDAAAAVTPHGKPQQATSSIKHDPSLIPRDLGLFEETFVMPIGPNRPSFFKNPKGRLKLEVRRLRNFVGGFISVVVYRSLSKPKPKLRLRQTAPTALALHQQMYTAFAEGDLSTLERICADGLLASFRSRIHARWAAGRPQYSLDWTIHKYTRFARVVSNRAIRLPIPDSGLRQAIVRISSTQSLAKHDFHGNLIPGTGEPKDVTEYLVIQKRLISGKETYWEVWGTVEETTVEKLEEADRIRRGD